MKKKKLLLSLVTLMTATTLAACSGGSNETLATVNGEKITKDEFYDEMRAASGNDTMQQLVIKKILEEKYGKEVSDKDVDEQYDTVAKQYGDNFDAALKQKGLTKDSYKASIRSNLLLSEAVKANISDEDYEKAFSTYATASHILVDSEDKAKEVLDKLKDGGDFAELAKEYSTDTGSKEDGGKITFTADSGLAKEFSDAAYKLEIGKYTTEPVKTQFGYHIIKLDAYPTKEGKKLADVKDELADMLVKTKINDQTSVTAVLTKLIQDSKVEFEDKSFEGLLDAYKKLAA